ncbi:hypothetical protein MSAS_43030 [Mycobacterium saskatchewanense]|uniref:Proline rich protein n=1 Tax=Mycobacterium saskatchewanense TaxID=220927 RepID=A0AAJ3NTH6_9MYCO|nr:hypothetical protein [Mycobacterium saskatchewanense]ORW73680.1 hypothetical protein AWC23_06210 [Mycobacterium saskatchewanense]BBX65129.1 hypothetical protein MSAS_43030 [Mycobacterium saskatchewanense]
MSEATESDSGTTPLATAPVRRPSRLNQALAWVGIVAGILFVAAVVFFSGFFFAWSSGSSHYGGHGNGAMGPGGKPASCPMMSQGAMMPDGAMRPGGMMPDGPMRPGNPPTATPAPGGPRP